MSIHLPDTFKTTLPKPLRKRFEYEFHSANYDVLLEVMTGLRTIISYLIKALKQGSDSKVDLEKKMATVFMLNLYGKESKESEDLRKIEVQKKIDVLKEIGIRNAKQAHLDCLVELPLTATYSCLKLFLNWVDDGFYDFTDLPFPLKGHMDDHALEQSLKRPGETNLTVLMKHLCQLADILKRSENEIVQAVDEAVQVRNGGKLLC